MILKYSFRPRDHDLPCLFSLFRACFLGACVAGSWSWTPPCGSARARVWVSQSESVWVIVSQSESVWASVSHCESLRVIVSQCESIWVRVSRNESAWCQRESERIRLNHLRQSDLECFEISRSESAWVRVSQGGHCESEPPPPNLLISRRLVL